MNNRLVVYSTIIISYSIQTALFHVEFQSIKNGRKHHTRQNRTQQNGKKHLSSSKGRERFFV